MEKFKIIHENWFQNGIISCEFLIISSVLVLPIGWYRFLEYPTNQTGLLLGFMLPWNLTFGILGVLGLMHHIFKKFDYQNPLLTNNKIVIAGFIFHISNLILWFVIINRIEFLHPLYNIEDCIISLTVNAPICSAVDSEVLYDFSIYYFVFGVPILLLLVNRTNKYLYLFAAS